MYYVDKKGGPFELAPGLNHITFCQEQKPYRGIIEVHTQPEWQLVLESMTVGVCEYIIEPFPLALLTDYEGETKNDWKLALESILALPPTAFMRYHMVTDVVRPGQRVTLRILNPTSSQVTITLFNHMCFPS